MTKAEKLEEETKLIAKFTGDLYPFIFRKTYHIYEEIDRVIVYIQSLGYTFSLISVNTNKGHKHITGFSNNSAPFNNIHIANEKNRLDAMYELVLKFIKEKDEQRQEKDN